MLRTPVLFLSLRATVMSYAQKQEMQRSFYKNNGSKVAVKVNEVANI